jgi:hypothetical protein
MLERPSITKTTFRSACLVTHKAASFVRASSALFALLLMTSRAQAEGEPLPATADPAPTPLSPPPPQSAAPPVLAPPAIPEPTSASSMRLTYEASRVDRAPAEPRLTRSPDESSVLHGFRLGYGYVANYEDPSPAFDNKSMKDKLGLRSPHHFLLGYEVMYRVVTHSWLNVLLLGNAIVAGLEQSKVLPSANLLIGAELKNTFQIGLGANLSPLKGSEGHTIIAAGWTPKVGTVYTPVHFFFIPDVDGNHRMGVTTGVTF